MLKRFVLAIALTATPVFAFAKDQAMEAANTALPETTTAVNAGPQNTIQLVWTVFLGGINLGTVGIKSSFSGDSYSAVSRLKTAGIVNSFYESVIDASSIGTITGNTLLPRQYDSSYNGEKSDQKVSLAYAANGIQLFSDPPYDVNRFPVSEEQKLRTLDPLSGIVYSLAGISITAQKPCGETVRVFDGRRRYDVELTFVGKADVSSSGYSGETIKCLMQYKQVAGFKPNLNNGNALPTITVWFATFQTKEPGPVKSFIVPVNHMAETPFGAAIAHARKITIDGEQKSG